MELVFCPLYSGSSGNCAYVQYGETRLLVDAGKSGKMITDALNDIGVDPKTLNGILVTHEHSDHISGVGVLSRRFGLPVYATAGTWQAMDHKLGRIAPEHRMVFDRDSDFYIDKLGVVPFAIPHDAADPVGYHFYAGAANLAIATDLGYMSPRVFDELRGTSLILLESNHDPDMLRANDHYSQALKRRILGKHGHLCNSDASDALVKLAETGVKHFVLGHLSGENNTPELALTTAVNYAELEDLQPGKDIEIDLAWRDRVGSVYTLQSDA